MKIYHIPLIPFSDNDCLYKPTREYYEGEADTLQGYIVSLLPELNAGDGVWRVMALDEAKVIGQIPLPYYVLCGEYPDEPPIMVAYVAK